MPKNLVVYRCLLVSPSDVSAERESLTEVVVQWNAQVGSALGAMVELSRWETHSVPDASAPPQEVLNRQIVDESDFAIAVFWSRLGRPTTSHESGSIEEIERLRDRGARVLVYFNSAPIPQAQLKDDQFNRLQQFRASMESAGLLGEYKDLANLREQVVLHLTSVVAQLLQRDRTQPSPTNGEQIVLTAPLPDVRVKVDVVVLMPSDGRGNFLRITVQNHSPVTVFVSNISIALRDGGFLMAPRDAITGEDQVRRQLQSGQSYAQHLLGPPLALRGSELHYALCTDEVGRTYRSTEEAMAAAVTELMKKDATPSALARGDSSMSDTGRASGSERPSGSAYTRRAR